MFILASPALGKTPGVSPFWEAVHGCEQPSSWYVHGNLYSGGLGIYNPNWVVWTKDLGIYNKYPMAYDAPPSIQAAVAHYGYKVWRDYEGRHASWGCIHLHGFGWLSGA